MTSSPSLLQVVYISHVGPYFNLLLGQCRSFSGHGGRKTNSSRSLPRQVKSTYHPEVLNRKVYWWSEHKPIRRSVYTLLNNHFEVKLFGALCRHSSMGPALWAHDLTLPGPFTAFLPTDSAMERLHPSSLQKLYDNPDMLKQFVRHHFVMGHWKYRDIIGSCVQPWKVYNHTRELPSITTMANESIQLFRLQPDNPQLMDLTLIRSYEGGTKTDAKDLSDAKNRDYKVEDESSETECGGLDGLGLHDWQQLVLLGEGSRFYRPEMRCHNGVVHLIDSPLVPPSWRSCSTINIPTP
eukprot:GHVS01047999.1.p1 GENE.GHVS01047999.1~~GHVS01047999.1.p1  ORF type:complete len:295 (+),score=38.72 GHVS01047999.1:213-1097(+)